MSDTTTRLTTAQALGNYRKELLALGFSEDQAFELVREAACTIVREDGLGVSR